MKTNLMYAAGAAIVAYLGFKMLSKSGASSTSSRGLQIGNIGVNWAKPRGAGARLNPFYGAA